VDRVGFVGDFYWTVHDGRGNDLRDTEPFLSREDAEAWMEEKWAGLLEEGGESASLKRGGEVLYRMGLRAL
jgi:hypothetical protein